MCSYSQPHSTGTPNSREPCWPPGMPSIPSWSPGIVSLSHGGTSALSASRAATGALCPASFFFSFSLFLFFFFFSSFPSHRRLLQPPRERGEGDCFKKKSVCGAARRRVGFFLPDDCTAQRRACACSCPRACACAQPRTKSPSQAAPTSAFPRAATQKRRLPAAAAPGARSRRRAGHRPRAPAAALPH